MQSTQMGAEQWGVAFRISAELVLFDTSLDEKLNSLERSEWRALEKNTQIAEKVGESIPNFLEMYVAFSKKLSVEDINILRSDNENARISRICLVLGRCEAEYMAWAEQVSDISLCTESELEAIMNSNKADEFEIYRAERTQISVQELFEYIKICGEATTDELPQSRAQLKGALEDALFFVAPYLTFVVVASMGD